MLDYRVIAAVVQELPLSCKWTADQRDRWLRAMTAAVDLLIDTQPEEPPPDTEGD